MLSLEDSKTVGIAFSACAFRYLRQNKSPTRTQKNRLRGELVEEEAAKRRAILSASCLPTISPSKICRYISFFKKNKNGVHHFSLS